MSLLRASLCLNGLLFAGLCASLWHPGSLLLLRSSSSSGPPPSLHPRHLRQLAAHQEASQQEAAQQQGRHLQRAAEPGQQEAAFYNISDEIRAFFPTGAPQTNFLITPEDRDDLGRLAESLGFTTGVELGVRAGEFSLHNLQTWPSCKKYYMVDIWAHQANYNDGANQEQRVQDGLYEKARFAVRAFADKAVIVRNLTVDAVHVVPGLVDFVYVDARHDYCAAMEDITMWWAKVRPGGILAGHDYVSAEGIWHTGQDWSLCSDGSRNKGAVKGAVNEFAFKHGLHVAITYNTSRESSIPTWVIRKQHHLHHGSHSYSDAALAAAAGSSAAAALPIAGAAAASAASSA